MFKLEHRPLRIYIGGRHLHHGMTGSVLIAIGVVLVATDWRDRPWRFIADFERYL